MNKKTKLKKGICPKCGADLSFNGEYGYIYCKKDDYKIGKREFDKLIK